jgi:hypothetical protein
MHDPGGEIERLIARLRARLGPDRLGPALAWVVTKSADELEELGLELTEDDRWELAAWVIELARRCP